METYTPHKWYWIVAGDETQVYASARAQYVLTDDSDYQQWLAEGGVPTRIASHDELAQVLTQANVSPYLRATPWQFRKALNQTGWRSSIDALLADGNTSQDIKDGFDVATEFECYHPDIIAMGDAIGMTETERIQIFELAQTL